MPLALDDDSLAAWIRDVIPLLEERSAYRRKLTRVLQRHEFRKQQEDADAMREFVSA
jgi:hypothetical protein